MKWMQMKQKGKRLLAGILAAVMITSAPGITLYAAEDEDELKVTEGGGFAGAASEPKFEETPAGEALENDAQEGTEETSPEDIGATTQEDPDRDTANDLTELENGKTDGPAAAEYAADTEGSSIDMRYDGFVFANGIPIVIKEVDGVTGIYDKEGTLLSGANVDVYGWNIYGGWYDEESHAANTSVVMESGTVNTIFGGSLYGTLNGNTSVTVNGGTVGWVYGGGNQSIVTGSTEVTINSGAKIWGRKLLDDTAEYKGTVFGGGYVGSAENTRVVFNGGDTGWIYGGGEDCKITNTQVQIHGSPIYEKDYGYLTEIYGGGIGGTVEKAVLKIYESPGNSVVYGGGYNDTVGETEIIIGENSKIIDASGCAVYGGGAPGSGSVVKTSSFQVQLTQEGQYVYPQFGELDGTGVDGRVSVSFKGSGEISQDYSINLREIDEVSIEGCRVYFQGEPDGSNSIIRRLHLDRLDTGTSGVAVFPVTLTEASIGKLAGSGTIEFSHTFGEWRLPGINIEQFLINPAAPVKINRTGPGMNDTLWTEKNLFQGSGVEALESAACFTSSLERFIIVKEEGVIKAKANTDRTQAYLISPLLNQSSYSYGETMEITLGLCAGYPEQKPIAGANVEILAGNTAPYKHIAGAVTDEDGQAVICVPVNDILWESCQHGLMAAFWGNDQYKPNFYGVSVPGGSGSMSFEVNPADIILTQEIAAPALGEAPVRTLDVPEDAFYTAQVVWSPSNDVFLPRTAYTASIRLTPKAGYSFDDDKWGDITYQGNVVEKAQKEADGSLLLSDVAKFEAIPVYEVILSASSFEGVEGAIGAGIYVPGQTVTIDAGSKEGYTFAGWGVSEGVTLTDASQAHTTFVMPEKDVTLTATWKKNEEPQPVTYEVTFAASSLEGVEGASGAGVYAPGATVTIYAGSKTGYLFTGWSVSDEVVLADAGQAQTTFVMPEKDVILTPNWEKISYGDVLPEDVPSDGKIPEGLWIAGVEKSYLYTGAAIKPIVRVYDYDKRLTEKLDYTVSYKNNKAANDASDLKKAPTVLVKGKGNYTDTDSVVFAIQAVDLESDSVTSEDITAAYNKKKQKKVPVVLFAGKKLSLNRDFKITYSGMEETEDAFKAPGEYDILLEGIGNFEGTKTVKFTITDKKLISKASVKRIPNIKYDGDAKEPELSVFAGKNLELKKDVDYEVEYRDNVEVGTATAILTGIGDYAGTKKVTFKITGQSIKSAKVDQIPACVFNGAPQEPDLVVRAEDGTLEEGKDYELTYTNHVNAGTASVVIKGIHAYTGSVRKTFRIEAYDFTNLLENQLKEKMEVKYMKGGSKPSPELIFGDMCLTAGTDYKITYHNHKAVTTDAARKLPSFTITGKGNFKGTFTKEYSIISKALQDEDSLVKLTIADKAFMNKGGGYVSKPVLTDADGKKLKAGKDYDKNVVYALPDGTVLDKKAKVEAGQTVKVKVAGKGAYTGELEAEYRITELNFGKVKVTIPAQSYTGEEIVLKEEDILVKAGRNVLTPGVDYEIVEGSYVNNRKKGRASVAIKGKGNYGGTKTVKFRIVSRQMIWFWNKES